MSSKLVERRLNDFKRRCGKDGDVALQLAYHAAMPVALNPELLHFLRINFILDPPEQLSHTVEFEFLTSGLCREIDAELYEIESETRNELLQELMRREDARQRIQDVATLLWQYVEYHSPWADRVELERAQQLTALNFLDPVKAKEWLDEAEANPSLGRGEREWFIAMRQEIEELPDLPEDTPDLYHNQKGQKILILAANPKSTTPLRLDEEVREIDAGLQRAKHRDQFVLEQKWAVRPRDIPRAFLDCNPQIVHFSGHGLGEEGLVFEDESGQSKLVSGDALAGLFQLFANHIECVVLNGCYSEVQANAIAQHINYVIGMKKAIGDRAAIEFAVGFYDALGAGHSIEFAYKFGCAAIRLAGIPEQLTPTLKKKPFYGSKDQPPVPSELASELDQELNDSDREVLTELLIRSGRAEYSARKALCVKIGIEPNQLGFLRQSTDADFALELISYLHSIGNKQALCKICSELEIVFKRGKYSADLENIKSKINCN